MRRSFTLIEIIFVLIILGILASIGSEIIVKVYENYLLTRSVSSSSYKLDVALLQISKRLSNRIKNTEVTRDDTDALATLSITGGTQFNHIEWIGRAYEVRRGEWNGSYNAPGYSGYTDFEDTNKTELSSPGSNLGVAQNIIKSLYGLDFNESNNGTALIFYNAFTTNPLMAFGWGGLAPTSVYTVYKKDNKTFNFDNDDNKTVSDIYNLACTAYALRHTDDDKLLLYYDYRPWDGDIYTNGNNIVLIDNVTTFKIRKLDRALEIRICAEDNTTGTPVEFCGKKVIF